MRICIEAQTLNHHWRSGLLTYTEGLVNSLYARDARNDYRLVFYSLRRTAEQMPGPSARNFRKHTLRLPDREFPAGQFLKDHAVLPYFLKKHRIDVFHRPAGYTLPRARGVFRILTVHDLRTLTMKDSLWPQDIGRYKRSLQEADICVTVSECTKQDIIEHFGLSPSKIKVVPLAVADRFRPQSQEKIRALKEKWNIRGPYFLSVGSVPRKNIEGIIRAFARARIPQESVLVMTCRMELEKYQSLAHDLGVGERVLFLKHLNDNELVTLYAGCQCLLFPSLYEGFGLPILEAMQCGVPVITSHLSSCPEVAGDAAIFVDPRKSDEIAHAIEQISGDRALRAALIEKGLNRVKLFHWDKVALEMEKVYASARS